MALAFLFVGSVGYANFEPISKVSNLKECELSATRVVDSQEIQDIYLGSCAYWVNVYINRKFAGIEVVYNVHIGCEGQDVLRLDITIDPIQA